MLVIDRTSERTTQQQIADYFRFEIGLGRRFKIGDTLPSTRELGTEAGVSYHTVRHAYRVLEEEGLVEGRPGSGYIVIARAALDSAQRLEKGAALVGETIRRLIALGLDISDIEYLVEEQLGFFADDQSNSKILVVGPYAEYAASIADRLSKTALFTIEHCTLSDLEQHADSDYVIVPVQLMRAIGFSLSNAEIITIDTRLPVETLEAVAKLLDYETLGLLTKYPDAIAPLTKIIKDSTGFPGQIIASTTDATKGRLVDTFVSQVDILLYTQEARRIVARHIDMRDTPSYLVTELLTHESMAGVRKRLPV